MTALEQGARRRIELAAAVALFATALLWGSNHVAARAIHTAVPLPSLIFWRWALGLVALLPLAAPGLLRERAAIRREAVRLLGLGTVGVGIFSVCLYSGAYHSQAVEVGLLNATTPIWVLLLAAAAGAAHPALRQVAGILIAMAGVIAVLAKGDLANLAMLRIDIGNLWSLFAAMAFAWYTFELGRRPPGLSALSLTAVAALGGFITIIAPLYVGFLILGGTDTLWSPDESGAAIWAVVYISLGPTLLGNLLWIYGTARIGAARAGPFLYLVPLASMGLSASLLGEPVAAFQIVGTAAILFGLWLSSRASRAAPPDA